MKAIHEQKYDRESFSRRQRRGEEAQQGTDLPRGKENEKKDGGLLAFSTFKDEKDDRQSALLDD
jgi:hypothetical protein